MCKEGLIIVYAGIVASALSFVEEGRLSLMRELSCTY